MSCSHNKKDCNLDMSRGCLFCKGEAGAETTICEGCFKLHETDWLSAYPDNAPTDIFEVRFKNTRKSYYKNINNLPLKKGDVVAVEASPGHDIGIITLTGDMVAKQMKRVGFNPLNGEFKAIYRNAKPYDIEKWQEAIAMEHETMIRSRQLATELDLDMKIGDVEYQGDRIKAIFYYIADGRVDFRELIKIFASEFGIKVEMKQIGARQEAGRIGGLGSCGRELCCASWISSFSTITTNAARTQDISLNPQKLAGQCCKLKCCLVYELDSYIDARKSFPRIYEPLQALDGSYHLISSDILSCTMSFSTSPGAAAGTVTLPVSKVKEVIDMNRKGKKPETLTGIETYDAKKDEPSFVNTVGEESITRFDTDASRKRSRPRNGQGRRGNYSGDSNRDGGGRNSENSNRKENNRNDKGEDGVRNDNRNKQPSAGNNNNRQPRQEQQGRNTNSENNATESTKKPDTGRNNNRRQPRQEQQGRNTNSENNATESTKKPDTGRNNNRNRRPRPPKPKTE